MTTLVKDNVFHEYRSSELTANSVYIHPTGTQAALINGVAGKGGHDAETLCHNWLQENLDPANDGDPHEIVASLNSLMSLEGMVAKLALVTYVPNGKFRIACMGEFFLVELESRRKPRFRSIGEPAGLGVAADLRGRRFIDRPYRLDWGYILSGSSLEIQPEGHAGFDLDDLRNPNPMYSDSLFDKLSAVAGPPDWSILTFPTSALMDFTGPDWPYDPFVGHQEELTHERIGLNKIAAALFEDPSFHGFKIMEAPQLPDRQRHSSRMVDGLLVSPLGIFLLELKHHRGRVTLELGANASRSMKTRRGDETNPVPKVRLANRLFASRFKSGIQQMLGHSENIRGLIVFTNENVDVRIVEPSDRVDSISDIDQFSRKLPYNDGDVLICTPRNLARIIKETAQPRIAARQVNVILTQKNIREMEEWLFGDSSGTQGFSSGSRINFDNPIISESSDYYTVYRAEYMGDPVWAKEYKLGSLTALSREEEFSSMGREVQILQQLGRRRVQGVQYVYTPDETGDALYVFIEPAYQRTLDDWIKSAPSRADRFRVMRKVAEILRQIADLPERVVHRAVNPKNIRVSGNMEPQLINFELCQRESLGTIPLTARRTLDMMYQAAEVVQPGKVLTPAADVFSFMLCLYFALAGGLPFEEDPRELARYARSRVFWRERMEQLGLPREAEDLWKRALHANMMLRPSIGEIQSAMDTWS